MNAPCPPHWTLNSYFGASHSVLMPLGMFCYDSKLGAKWAKLVQVMQKFVPQKCVGIFCDKRTQSTPLDPKHMFWCVAQCFGVFQSVWMNLLWFRNCMKLGAKRCELVQLLQKFVPRSHNGIFRNENNQSTPLDPIQMFRYVSQYLGAFGIIA